MENKNRIKAIRIIFVLIIVAVIAFIFIFCEKLVKEDIEKGTVAVTLIDTSIEYVDAAERPAAGHTVIWNKLYRLKGRDKFELWRLIK